MSPSGIFNNITPVYQLQSVWVGAPGEETLRVLEIFENMGKLGVPTPKGFTEFHSSYQSSFASVQLTLTFFLLAMGAGQLIFGPIVDAYGRRRPLLAGLLLFTLCSLGAAWAPTLETLIALRFVQGLGSALTLV
eukprot:gene39177-48388_t